MNPDFEVKVLLKASAVLGSDNKPNDAVASAFSLSGGAKKMNVQFFDTNCQEIYKSGWSLRIRKSEGENEFEVNYKKRYPLDEGFSTTDADAVSAGVKAAESDGFASSLGYEAQVEVGYQKKTLSISHTATHPDSGFSGTTLPAEDKSREFLNTYAPEKFRTWASSNWGSEKLEESRIYGPVLAKRFKGKWNGLRVSIEVWPIRSSKLNAELENIVEVSFKADILTTALEQRGKLVAFVESQGWLVPKDSLKTALIMERY
ncbi:hypothetical protein IQ07DRAFT_583158 [Pyrenochaeta sp. DS3sAY3a]|nr:hypothetical protein IQ07DRAFT_583158 [Pyrenochaeta sp. DS3sAY3a]